MPTQARDDLSSAEVPVTLPDLDSEERAMVDEMVGRLRNWRPRNAVFQQGLDRVASALEQALRR